MNLKKRSVALLCVLAVLLVLMSTAVLTVGAEDRPMTDSKTVILEFTGEPIDVSTLFDEQPAGAVYSFADDGSDSETGSEAELVGNVLNVTIPGSFRVCQTTDNSEVWISLGVYYTLTVTVKDQSVSGIGTITSTAADVASVVGLREGDTLTAVTLVVENAAGLHGHDGIKATGATVTDSEGRDVSTFYNVNSVNGDLHHFSAEWGTEEDVHFLVCSAMGCELHLNESAHTFDNACDNLCDVCSMAREVPEHVWTADCIVLREATETEEGECVYVCQVCGKNRVEVIPKLDNTPVVLIVCLIVACAIVLGSVAYFVVHKAKKKAELAKNEQDAPAEEKQSEE